MKNFLMKQMIKSKLKNLPKDQQDQILNALQENPEFFTQISKEIQEKIKEGKDQMSAAMEVMQNHKDELGKLFGK